MLVVVSHISVMKHLIKFIIVWESGANLAAMWEME